MRERQGVTAQYQIHEIANVYPRMPGDEFVALKKDIKEKGLLEAIWLYEGKVLDGRHRYYACQETGTEPSYRQYEGDDPVGFVISMNRHRRHLSASQLAAAAVSARSAYETEAKKRQGFRTDISANLRESQKGKWAEKAAVDFGTSPRNIETAAMVERDAPLEIFEAIKSGAMSVHLASQVAALPYDNQFAIAAVPADQIKEVAREAIHNHRAQGSGENEWYTPEQYIEAAREMLGAIDVDPASSALAQETVKAGKFFTVADDGLNQDWTGRVWLNPPYAQPAIQHFMQKAVDEFQSGRMTEGVALTHNYTDTQWFHLAARFAGAICFTRGRIGFLSPEGKKAAPTQGQAFFYFGDRIEEFADAFCRFGFVMVKP